VEHVEAWKQLPSVKSLMSLCELKTALVTESA
jgi:hypothetical protein